MYTLVKSETAAPVQFIIYPLLIASGITAYFLLLGAGFGTLIASFTPVLVALAVILVLEKRLPYRADWNAEKSDIKTDLAFLTLVQGILPKLMGLGVVLFLSQTGFELEELERLWPGHWYALGQLLLMILLADLLRYWLHVAAHKIPLLWKLHAVHHQPHKLYSLNVARFHPCEKALQFVFDSLPFILLGVSAEVITCYFVFYAINGFIQHSNIDLKFGFLNYLVSSSELHRWHHDEDPATGDCNYGNNLIVWDLIFGSFYLPGDKCVGRVGVSGSAATGFFEAVGFSRGPGSLFTGLKRNATNFVISLMYAFARILYWRRFEQQCRRPRVTQNRLLKIIIEQQSCTRFGQRHGFGEIRSYAEFRDRVEVNSYEDLRPLFAKQALQGCPELTSEAAILYTQTSGSTGKPKYIPVTEHSLNDMKRSQALASLMMYRACPSAFEGKMLGIVSPVEEGSNEWGQTCGSASGLILKSMPAITRRQQLLTPEVLSIPDHDLKYDVILLQALAEESLSFIGTANPSTLLMLHHRLNSKRDYFLETLAGRPEPRLLRAPLTISCGGARLDALQRLFASKDEVEFADLWPELSLVVTWAGGSCGIALDAVRKILPPACRTMELGYVASEFRGTITHYGSQLGIPTLHENFFEFVEKDKWETGQAEFLQLDEIETGNYYYIFVTNLNGLYRYDINDIVKVSGFFKNTPCLDFVQKGKGVTSITGEKLYESQLIEAIKSLSLEHSLIPVFYVCLADETNRCYRLFLETCDPVEHSSHEISAIIDRELCATNIEYQNKRASGRLGHIEVRLVQSGTSEVYKKTLVDQGQRECQFKVMTLQYARQNGFPFEQHCVQE